MANKCPKCAAENPKTVKFCGECGTPLPALKGHVPAVTETFETPVNELTTGSTFAGRYQVIEELGHGGMGRVYKVFDTKIREKIALKLIRPEVASDKDTIERFGNEIRLARRIGHRNVCKMFDIGEAEGAHFITMEYVQGEDLKSMIHMSGSLSLGMLLSVGKQVSDGLAEAHGLGVVHRDLKPQNIMINKNGNAKIMDFGIARSVREKGITGPSVMIGTPEYMSPEQAEVKDVDHRSDIYSLGVILYEMATSHVPFEGETALGIAMKHKGDIPKNPKQLNPNLPDDLSGVILKCLEKDKAKRFQNACDLRADLERIEKGLPTTERVVPMPKPVTSKEITVKFSPRKLLIPGLVMMALVIAAIVIWRAVPQKTAAPAKSAKHSIAVLPFEDLSPTKVHEYLCDGIAETLINSLSNIKDLWVPPRTSSFSFKGKDLGIHEIGRQLGVDNLLEASVQVVGTRLRITPKIINADDGSLVWSAQYDRQMEDVFAIQDEIAREIIKALKIKLLGEKEAPLIKSYTGSTEAYQAFIKGRFYWNKRTAEGMRKSVEYFEQAIEIDPSYAVAYVGLADSYITLGQWIFLRPKEAFPKAKEAALKALAINDSLGEAHTSLAAVKYNFDWDWKGSEKEFKRAIELSPNYSTAHQWYGELLVVTGRLDEGLKELKRAQELDPLSLIINAIIGGWFCYYARDYDTGIIQCKRIIEMDPEFHPAHQFLWWNYVGKKMYEEALKEAQKTNYRWAVASLYAIMNRPEEARRLLADIIENPEQSEIGIARVYFQLGKNEEGWKWLEKAYDERAYSLIFIKMDPFYDQIRPDPRFQALLKKVGLE